MADVQHSSLTGAELHEPKGVASASALDVYKADGAGSGSWVQPLRMGWWDYNDSTTSGSPIALTVAGTYYKLTNDGAGANTNKTHNLTGITDIWDTTNDQFDFSSLTIGDTIDIRFDVTVTTSSANTVLDADLEMANGTGSAFDIDFIDTSIKTAGTYNLNRFQSIYIGSTTVRDNPAIFKIKADTTGATVVVNGWYIRVLTRGEF